MSRFENLSGVAKRLRWTVAALGIALGAQACSDSPERTDSVSQAVVAVVFKWSTAATPSIERLAPRNDGSALASTRDDVFAFSTLGVKSVLFNGTPTANRTPLVSEGTEGFGVPTDTKLDVYNALGVKKATVNLAPREYARLIPGTLGTFVPVVVATEDTEHASVTSGRVFSAAGALSTTFSAPDLVQSRTTATHVLWTTRTMFRKTALSGASAWTLTMPVQQFETNSTARYSIVNRRPDTRVVELYDEFTKIGTSTFPKAVWDVSIAPNGTYAAAHTKAMVRVFKNGALQATVNLATSSVPTSIDVSNLGYLLVGTHSPGQNNCGVALYDSTGILRWQKTLAADADAYRPDVRFTPDGLGFFIREANNLSFYGLVNP